MLLLGIDMGTSFTKVSVVNAATKERVASSQYPDTEAKIISLQPGWAEQSPETWWQHIKSAIKKLNASGNFDPKRIAAIGIAYQMHGLVLVDKNLNAIRDSIIWCDSRAVQQGHDAFEKIGSENCLQCLLNSPGNFTASKLAWVKQNEPGVYQRIYKLMLPGDFAAMKFTGTITTTPSALSEGIFWDFRREQVSKDILNHFGFDRQLFPDINPVFSIHGTLLETVAAELGLSPGTPVSYKAGDQLNNAVALGVFEPGEVAATAGTSGVIYAITDQLFSDRASRVNAFAHVNHSTTRKRLGVLLCINGTGIMNRWIKDLAGENYDRMNQLAREIEPGSDGLLVFPFGNGAERMLENRIVGANILGLDLNRQTKAHVFRAVQEGIAFSFRYGLDIMRENKIYPSGIHVGRSNLFFSDLFSELFVDTSAVPVQLYETDGSVGAAFGAGLGSGIYSSTDEVFSGFKPSREIEPSNNVKLYNELYERWKAALSGLLQVSQ